MIIDTEKTVMGQKIFDLEKKPVNGFAQVCRKAAADGAVLLKNDNKVLPLIKGEKVSVFGRIASTYYKSGTGSGGMVNVEYVTDIISSLKNSGEVEVNDELRKIYDKFIEEHPFDLGKGWAQEPWSQAEMPLTDEIVKNARDFSSKAIIVIGRTAGEDKDNHLDKGSFLLTDTEKDMIKKVSEAFDQVCVVVNAGNVIDNSFIDEYKIDALLYVWHGGQEGGNAAADVLCGKVNPSGRLSDTVAYNIADYPSNDNFGAIEENKYVEDIYVGYRYFETFAKEKVRFPFGFGLSYTEFETVVDSCVECDGKISVNATVKNIGEYAGRQIVQVYYGAPQGKLGKPAKALAAFKKTGVIEPGSAASVTIEFSINSMASYDDSGITGHKSAYVLEDGVYTVYVGDNVRDANEVFSLGIEQTVVVEQLTEAMAPVKDFSRIKPLFSEDGNAQVVYEPVPKRTVDLYKRINDARPTDITYTGNKGYKLVDVADGKCTMDEFVAQMTDFDLACIVRGEGMNSPKVTPGTGCAFGGVSDALLDLGIPVCCGSDGPSGLRLDSGAKATSTPIGTLLACTWDTELVEELYTYEGMELFAYSVDTLLGPGMNIHRHPLNGRNFEYFSEDPYLTGMMGAAISRGIAKSGPTATIKHFIANNQEISRSHGDSVISERAIREIYLRGFEIAVKEGGATAVMTTYNPTNGFWNASNYDLNTTILRDEWGFTGFVMTDWWAKSNIEGEEGTTSNLKAMVRAQNDIYMVCRSAVDNNDNIMEGLSEGFITRGELQRNAKNILNYILLSPAFKRFVLGGCVRPNFDSVDDSKMETIAYKSDFAKNDTLVIELQEKCELVVKTTLCSSLHELSQSSIICKADGNDVAYFSINGGDKITQKRVFELNAGTHTIALEFEESTSVLEIEIKK